MTDTGTRVLLMSDTHLPKRAKDLPAELWAAVESADLVVHAGDWVEVGALDALESRSRRLLACWGNNDGDELRARLPEVARATVEGVRVAVVHETGQKQRREERMRAEYPDVDLLVFGHSHIPWDTQPRRAAAAQPRVTDGPAPPARLHVDDAASRRRRDPRRRPAPAASALTDGRHAAAGSPEAVFGFGGAGAAGGGDPGDGAVGVDRVAPAAVLFHPVVASAEAGEVGGGGGAVGPGSGVVEVGVVGAVGCSPTCGRCRRGW